MRASARGRSLLLETPERTPRDPSGDPRARIAIRRLPPSPPLPRAVRWSRLKVLSRTRCAPRGHQTERFQKTTRSPRHTPQRPGRQLRHEQERRERGWSRAFAMNAGIRRPSLSLGGSREVQSAKQASAEHAHAKRVVNATPQHRMSADTSHFAPTPTHDPTPGIHASSLPTRATDYRRRRQAISPASPSAAGAAAEGTGMISTRQLSMPQSV